MAILEWKESYSVGIKSIDVQHKRLLELINELSALNPKTVDKQKVFSALNALVDYAQIHFDTEEGYLKEHEYSKLDQQQREHVTFTADVFRFAQQLEKNNPSVQVELLNFVKDWYISHVLGTDREYIEFLASKGVT